MAYTKSELNHYKKHPEEITASLDSDLISELIDYDPKNIKRIPQTVDLIERAYARDPQIFRYVDFSVITPSFLDRVIDAHPLYIRYIRYPSPELIKKALIKDINVMPHVEKYLTESMFEWLVSRNGLLLQYIPETKQTLQMTTLAIHNNVKAYKYAHNKSKETDIYVVTRDTTQINSVSYFWPELIDYFVNYNATYITKFFYDYPGFVTPPRLKVILDAEPELYQTIPNPSLDIMKYALSLNIDMYVYMPYRMDLLEKTLETNGLILKYYRKKSLKTIKNALNSNVRALDYLEFPRKFLIDYAFSKDGYALKYIENPTYDQCFDAVKRNWEAFQFIPPQFVNAEIQLYAIATGGLKVLPILGVPKNEDVIMQLLNLQPSYIFKIEQPTSKMFQAAFAAEGQLIMFYQNWNSKFNSDEIGAALSQDGTILEYVKNKSKTLALIAIRKYPLAIQWTIEFQDLEIAYTAVNGDPRALFFVRKDVLDAELLKMALTLDPDFYTRAEGEMTWEEWLEITGLGHQ